MPQWVWPAWSLSSISLFRQTTAVRQRSSWLPEQVSAAVETPLTSASPAGIEFRTGMKWEQDNLVQSRSFWFSRFTPSFLDHPVFSSGVWQNHWPQTEPENGTFLLLYEGRGGGGRQVSSGRPPSAQASPASLDAGHQRVVEGMNYSAFTWLTWSLIN